MPSATTVPLLPEKEVVRAWQTLLAFAIIYLVWGSTFLAIRIGVHEVPPLLFAAMRFLVAGVILYGWMRARGEASPSRQQWASVFVIALLIFVIDYGLLFWAEQRVASGIAAVIMATIPAFTVLAEILILRTQRFTARLGVALLTGIGGVAVLLSHSLGDSGSIDRAGAIGILIAAICWSIASSLSRKLPLPPSKAVSSGAQMLAGGVMLVLTSAAFGEFHQFHPAAVSRAAWISLVYLIIAGSIIGFTAYVWLIHHQSPTRVATYAFVNPVVAVGLGYLFAAEPLGPRTVLGTVCIIVSVVLLTTQRKPAAT